MFDKIRGIYQGKIIAVLGSAPSVRLYTQKEDITLGVNGASRLLNKGDFFVAFDAASHLKPWFYTVGEGVINMVAPHSAIYSDRFYPDASQRLELITQYETFLEQHKDHVELHRDGIRNIPFIHLLNDFNSRLPEPQKPHMLLRYARRLRHGAKISLDQQEIITGGTVGCIATQIAFQMGAKEIHLYGIEFSNEHDTAKPRGINYFYEADLSEGGYTTESQRQNFDQMLAMIQKFDVPVFAHGPTRLENIIRIKD